MKRIIQAQTVLILSLLFLSASAQTPDRYTGVWNIYYGNFRVRDRWGIHAEFMHQNAGLHIDMSLTRLGVVYHFRRGPILSSGIGYLVSTPNIPDVKSFLKNSREFRLWQELRYTQRWGRFQLAHRSHFEERWRTGNHFSTRVRYRLQARLAVNRPDFEQGAVSLVASNEVFLNLPDGSFNQNWTFGGLAYQVNPALTLQSGYLYNRMPAHNQGWVQTLVMWTPNFRER